MQLIYINTCIHISITWMLGLRTVAHHSSKDNIKLYEAFDASKLDVQQPYGAMFLMCQMLCHEAVAGKVCGLTCQKRVDVSMKQAKRSDTRCKAYFTRNC